MEYVLRPILVILCFLVPTSAAAFGLKLDTVKDYFDSSAAALPRKTIPFLDGKYPVHQTLTLQTLNCGTPGSPCEALKAVGIVPHDIMRGVRWNDFPAFYMTKNARTCEGRILQVTNTRDVHCFILMLAYAYLDSDHFGRDANWEIRQPIGARGHFGRLQFWHSMAQANQSAGATYDDIQMWMEFGFRVSLGEFDLTEDITTLPVPGLNALFMTGARKTGDLLDYKYNDDKVMTQGIALGQMLHIAQDSFARCHAQRDEEGKMVRFYNYAGQNVAMHKHYDNDDGEVELSTSRRLNPYDFGERLLRLRAESTRWEDARPKLKLLVEEFFRPANPYLLSRKGDGCHRP